MLCAPELLEDSELRPIPGIAAPNPNPNPNPNYDQYQVLLQPLVKNTLTLVKDPYGNYAVQFILDKGDPQMYFQMFSMMRGHIPRPNSGPNPNPNPNPDPPWGSLKTHPLNKACQLAEQLNLRIAPSRRLFVAELPTADYHTVLTMLTDKVGQLTGCGRTNVVSLSCICL